MNSSMNRYMKRIFVTYLILSCTAGIGLFAQKKVRSAIREGNSLYNKEAFLDSEISYRKALEVNPSDSIATFNLGNSLFRQQDEEKVKESFNHYNTTAQNAAKAGNKSLAAKAFYNAGDVMMAAQQYDKAIEYFKQSLKNDPSDHGARYNLVLAQKLLQKNQDQNQDDQQDQQQQQQQQDQQQQDQQQQQQNQDQQQEQNQDQQEQQNQEQQQQDQQQQDQQQQQNQMSQEQAEAILNANNRDEKETQQKVKEKQMQQVKRKQTGRDW